MTDRKPDRRGLGRGLSALMADISNPAAVDAPGGAAGVVTVPIDAIRPNPAQPRRSFDEQKLTELAESIARNGVVQPIILRPRDDGYEIVAGERRWRAAQLARLHEIPAVVRNLGEEEVLEIAIVENVQREDLNAIEEASAYRMLAERFGHSQDQIAAALGKSRSHVANTLRLLGLPDRVQALLRDGSLSAGHARALIGQPDPEQMAERVIRGGLTVRQTEDLARQTRAGRPGSRQRSVTREKDSDTRALEADLSAALGMAVIVTPDSDPARGTLTVRYETLEGLDWLCAALTRASGGFRD